MKYFIKMRFEKNYISCVQEANTTEEAIKKAREMVIVEVVESKENKEKYVDNFKTEEEKKALSSARFVIVKLLLKYDYADATLINRCWFPDDLLKKVFDFVKTNKKIKSLEDVAKGIGVDKEELRPIYDYNPTFANLDKEKAYYEDCLKFIADRWLIHARDVIIKKIETSLDFEEKKELLIKLQQLCKSLKSNDIKTKKEYIEL